MNPSPYGWLILAGIAASLVLWRRLAQRDDRLLLVYVAALIGAFFGAKLAYVFAEGWWDFGQPDIWRRLATGKSILGALLGGYGGVELGKRLVGYAGVTGDWFALAAPLGIMLGRVGCWLHGCCLGRVCEAGWFALSDATGAARWPAVPVEILFNAVMAAFFFILRRPHKLAGQHFHVYLTAYGFFRFAHEFLRDTPRWAGTLSGYHLIALVVAAFGAICFLRRARKLKPVTIVPCIPA